MKIRVKAKAVDYGTKDNKESIVNAIKEAEQKFPNLELVHVYGLQKNELKLYNVDEESYVSPLDEEQFIDELNKKLESFSFMAYPYREKIIIDPAGSRNLEKRNQVENPEDNDSDELIYENENQEYDTQWRYGSVTERKLQIFIERYGMYLRDETAELNYNRNRGMWGPKFGYKRDEGDAPSDAMREEIRDYINDVFYQ